jgi:hypothetical protein
MDGMVLDAFINKGFSDRGKSHDTDQQRKDTVLDEDNT